MIGSDQHRLRDHHGRRREEEAEIAQRAGARQQEVDGEARHDRRQAHQGVKSTTTARAAGKARKRERAPSGRPTRPAIEHGAAA